MAHHEHDHENESYYLDQLCMIALSGAFGVICLALYFWQQWMLRLMLDPKFFQFILISGIMLIMLALIRGFLLWREVAEERTAPAGAGGHSHAGHSHSHGHDHGGHAHSHGGAECNHDHGGHAHAEHGHSHGGVACDHDHGGHSHSHGHGVAADPATASTLHQHAMHDHDEADHDHGWAPWRYVLVLVPIIFFLLGLPNKGPKVVAKEVDSSLETMRTVETIVSTIPTFTPLPMNAFAWAARNTETSSANATQVGYKELEAYARDEASRKRWNRETVKVKGQFSPDPRARTRFNLARFRINCCANDAIPLNVPIISAEPISNIRPGDWVEVTGRVEFLKTGDSYRTVLMTTGEATVKPSDPDPNPYVQ
ncbi:MAG: hypothetical protein U0744_10795 [Gemmataceae bacterium]